MSWYDDFTSVGLELLDDVGEGLGNMVTNATTPDKPETSPKSSSDQAANPATHQQPSQTVVDQHGNAVTRGFGESWVENKPVMMGGIALAVLLVLVLLVLAVRK